ncbi:hypothetical protein B0J11DRAFT_75237 [Dendryphion nanum]|uniref:Helicase C-terminal domain-containing protein n=1 Tax=Dendryphion nanum TaxID=256645 RepID=A0A9P9DGX4_9PLEO|nr:hypothetical protein B0J11DRAFT_75237 [Dendryphion nanum]
MLHITSFFTKLGKRKREGELSADMEGAEEGSGSVASSPSTIAIALSPSTITVAQPERKALHILKETSQRTNASPPPRKQRRVLMHVAIPFKPRPTVTDFVAVSPLPGKPSPKARSSSPTSPVRTCTPQSHSTAGAFQRHVSQSRYYTNAGAYIPAWKRLGLTISQDKKDITSPMRDIDEQTPLSVSSQTEKDGGEVSTFPSKPAVVTQTKPSRSSIENYKLVDANSDDVTPRESEIGIKRLPNRPRRSAKRLSYIDVFVDKDRSLHGQILDSVVQDSQSESDFSAPDEEDSVAESDDDVVSIADLTTDDTKSLPYVNKNEGVLPRETELPKRNRKATTTKAAKTKDMINLSLPPLTDIKDIFSDMVANAMKKGLSSALKDIKDRPLNVATMCSGTESPLIALQLVSQALQDQGYSAIEVNHHFSAEIEPFKQGFIERNFQPKILFRDVREFISQDATATTAYGADVTIPQNLDILVAGFVCKDLSRLNNKRKSLEDEGESGDTWNAVYNYSKRFRPSVVLIENVKSTSEFWDSFKSKWKKIGYESTWHICDTKHYYLPQTRQRMYMIAINQELFGPGADKAASEWKGTMTGLQRACSSPFEAFLSTEYFSHSDYVSRLNESDWVLCKLRYDTIRSDERLGRRNPISQWSENGSIRPPDFANRKWYNSQSSRVYDAIDIKYLQQAADPGEDSLFKMAIWDVSQNVERFNTSHGIAPCITPNGCDFISNRQTSLNGSQLLLLQGMPMNKLHFGKETQKEQQDLAGNAMSTTVIGASILAALISARKSFRSTPAVLGPSTDSPVSTLVSDYLIPASMDTKTIPPTKPDSINIGELQIDARLSSALCNCEGTKHVSSSNIQECGQCGHTACSSCAGNPRHEYFGKVERKGLVLPTEFEQKWRPRLPGRVLLPNFSEARPPVGNSMKPFAERLSQLNFKTNYFTLSRFKRSEGCWQIVYESTEATLELLIGKTVLWHLYVTCPTSELGNSVLRAALGQPIARGSVQTALMEPIWEIFTPSSSKLMLSLTASVARTKSWRNRLGLLDYRKETVPSHIDVSIEGRQSQTIGLAGKYVLLPNCGTSFSSLYKKVDSNHNPLYLLHDPDAIGPTKLDPFVFSHNISRMRYGETRPCLARLPPSWRPWHNPGDRSISIESIIPGEWTKSSLRLEMDSPAIKAQVASLSEVSKHVENCSRPVKVIEATIPCRSSTYQWAVEKVKLLPTLSEANTWHILEPNSSCSEATCDCAPAKPSILWNVDEKGVCTAYEDRKASALFERAIKTRPQILDVRFSIGSNESVVQVGFNVASLVHRARGRMASQPRLRECTTSWRLIADHVEPAWEPFDKLRLSSNAGDLPYSGHLGLQYELGDAQKKSLTWMRNQERGVPLTITEIEEEIHPIGWRVEARADATVSMRGGILADLPSFGKTITTIALIHDEFKTQSQEAILENNGKHAPPNLPALFETTATLVICPPTLVKQWPTELRDFLGDYNVLIVERVVDLQKLTIEDVQKAQVIVVSWKVFLDPAYVAQIACFTAVPEPASTKPRAYDAWLDFASQEVPKRVQELQQAGAWAFDANTSNVLLQRLGQPEFKAIVPLRIGHGSAYKSYSSMKSRTNNKKTTKKTPSPPNTTKRSNDWTAYPASILHMFRFNRIVVDEYHYICEDTKNTMAYAAIRTLSSHKRWLLSGTPALANFSDVNRIAGIFGVSLGRDNHEKKKLLGEQTDVEKFLSQMEKKSYFWHKAQHERAQAFLDNFARQNEPSLEHIACSELISPVELGLAHHIVYLELSQHLISQKMQMKKLKGSSSDRIDRLNSSLNNSDTAEEALLKSALIFQASEGQSGIDGLINKREKQISETKRELLTLMKEAEGFQNLVKDKDGGHYITFKRDLEGPHALGDGEVARSLRRLARSAETSPTEVKKVASLAEKLKMSTSNIRSSAQEMLLRTRSLRFIKNVEKLAPLLDSGNTQTPQTCDSPNCSGSADVSQLFVAYQCGHFVCEPCLAKRVDNEDCIHDGCDAPFLAPNLLRLSDLGVSRNKGKESLLGAKIHAVVNLITSMPDDDQGLIFVPNDETMDIVEEALESYDISFHSVGGSSSTSETVEDFKNNSDPKTRKKLLILNLNDDSASGLNLVNANHVIFIAPILAESQYQYDSAMAQAIARCRRYRQKKKVHVYHFVALNTIDVDILEHRHKRFDAIGDSVIPRVSQKINKKKKEKTRLIRNTDGKYILLPISWLGENDTVEELRIGAEMGMFTSLINFSESFARDGNE